MDDAFDVRLVERAEDLPADVADALERQREVLLDGAVQIAPVEQLHGDEEQPLVVAEVDDLQDVRMRQHRGALGLAIEALGQRRVAGHGVVQHLERDLLAEIGLLGEVDAAHGAGAEEPLDAELLR